MSEQETAVQWDNRIVGHDAAVDPNDLLANPWNFRIHSHLQQGAIEEAVRTYGWVKSVIVNVTTGHIVDGHGRVTVAARHEQMVPVEYVRLTEEEEQLALASLDHIVGMAGTDKEKLAELMGLIESHEVQYDDTLTEMLAEMAAGAGIRAKEKDDGRDTKPKLEEMERLQEKWGTAVGQLWILPTNKREDGDHRLICGDCTDPTVVARLLDILCRLLVTDPPYGVEYNQEWRSSNRVGEVKNDDRADWSEDWALADAAEVIYCWHASRYASTVQDSLEAFGFDLRAQIIWAKPVLVFSQGHYHWQHEPCHYGVRKGATAQWVGDRKQTTLWAIDPDADVAGGHSTQKPLECMERPIRNHAGDVYDPFGGSGTTLVAAENQGRLCRMAEIHPGYVAIILERYWEHTGLMPYLAE